MAAMNGPPLAPPRIHGDGHDESDWQASPWLAALPEQAASGLLGDSRLVIVSPHPDDEVLGCGGLIQQACARGLALQVIAVSQGEACYPGDPQWPAARLRQLRSVELVRALAALGAAPGSVCELGLPDGAVAAHAEQLTRRLRQLLKPGDLVLTTWRHDGHPDHEATARATCAAAAACGARLYEFPVWAWHWLPSASVQSPWPQAVKVRLSAAAWSAKQRAIACFASQLAGAPYHLDAPILPPNVLARFQRRYEVFLP